MNIQWNGLLALLPLSGNTAFFGGIVAAALTWIVAIVFGVKQFQKPLGKFVAVTAGVVLVALLGFVLFVLVVSESASRGNPM